jgi:hypothetical protein
MQQKTIEIQQKTKNSQIEQISAALDRRRDVGVEVVSDGGDGVHQRSHGGQPRWGSGKRRTGRRRRRTRDDDGDGGDGGEKAQRPTVVGSGKEEARRPPCRAGKTRTPARGEENDRMRSMRSRLGFLPKNWLYMFVWTIG